MSDKNEMENRWDVEWVKDGFQATIFTTTSYEDLLDWCAELIIYRRPLVSEYKDFLEIYRGTIHPMHPNRYESRRLVSLGLIEEALIHREDS